MKSVALHNLGCKVNSYELEVIQQMLLDKGYQIVSFDEMADIYIVNTCTVTNIADRKSRQMLHRAKAKNPNAVVVAVGCYVQAGSEKIKLDKDIDLAIGNNRKNMLVSILEEYLIEHQNKYQTDILDEQMQKISENDQEDNAQSIRNSVIDINQDCEYEEMTLKKTAEHTRAYIKIQDGCNQFCSYCIIPYARGRVRSRKVEDILQEIKGIIAAGYQEVVLTGIHISSYGIDLEDIDWQQGISVGKRKEKGEQDYSGTSKLIDLIEKIQELEGLKRIRIGSLEPRIITEEFATRLSKLDKLCPHFHLSLQSGADETLERMNRHYTAGLYYESVDILRKLFQNPAITTDIIVGFPGETEEEFEETYQYLSKIQLYEMHIFKYSIRQGTKAAQMQNQVPEPIKTKRSQTLLSLEKELSKSFREKHIGKKVEVLFEEGKEMFDAETGKHRVYQLGYTADYVKVAICIEENKCNQLENVVIDGFINDDILCGHISL